MSNQTVYVELNTLMDTRLACVESIYDANTAQELLKGAYDKRVSDDWSAILPKLSTKAIEDLYTHHDITILARAMMTNMVSVLKDFIAEVNKGTSGNPLADPVSIHINTAPYNLPESHCQVIVNSIAHHVGITDIKTINVPRHITTPAFFQGTYKTVFMYDFIPWFTMHHSALRKQHLSEMVWYVPKLKAFGEAAQNMEASLDETATMFFKKMNVWDAATIALTGYMNLQFLDIKAFNMYT